MALGELSLNADSQGLSYALLGKPDIIYEIKELRKDFYCGEIRHLKGVVSRLRSLEHYH